MMCLAAMTASAQTARQSSDSLYIQKSYSQEQMLMPVNPTYLKNVSEAANWGRNWFIEAKGGASAFLGTPIGCGDVFDRVTPLLQIGVGKWFTPAIGGRIGFQGLSFKNAEFHTMKYQFVHADFLYNITSGIRQNESGIPLWDVIPFVGVGMIHNSDWINNCTCQGGSSGSHPFAFTYGVEARYRISDRVHLVGEVSGMLTAKNFDGIGTSTKFGDNMISVSAGLSFTIGKTGWKRVVDATPYIEQNLALQDYIAYMRDRNAHLEKRLAGNDDGKTVYPKNSYSGLNSLRARLSMNGISTSSRILLDRICNAVLVAQSPGMKSYLGTIRDRKGHDFNSALFKYVKDHASSEIVVKPEVKICQGKTLDADKDYGDIDLLIIDTKSKIIKCVEAKDFVESRYLWQLLDQEKKIIGALPKVCSRDNWCRNNIRQFSKICHLVDNSYTIQTVFLTYNLQPETFDKSGPYKNIKFVSLIDLIKDPKMLL